MPNSFHRSASKPKPSLKMHFQGRVYRSGDLSPSKQRKLAKDPAELLGVPDELSIDTAYEATSSRSELLSSPVIASTPTKRRKVAHAKTISSDEDDEDLAIHSSPTASPIQVALKKDLSRIPRSFGKVLPDELARLDLLELTLPDHYLKMLNIHAALERALMMYLSTDGKGGRIASAVAQAFQNPENIVGDQILVKLTDLITFHQLKPLIEQAGGHDFSEAQFEKLLWLWSSEAQPPSASQPVITLSGLGFLVNKTTHKMINGKSINTWGLGIELRIQRHEEPSLSLVSSNGSAPVESKGKSTLAANARDGMSVVALWSLGAEARKLAIRRKLALLVLAHYQDSVVAPSRAEYNAMLPTPPSSKHKGAPTTSLQEQFDTKFSIHTLPEVPSRRLPMLKSPKEFHAITALLTESEQASEAISKIAANRQGKKISAKDRANSMMERIRAKEKALSSSSPTPDLSMKPARMGLSSPSRRSLKANSAALERERQKMAALKRRSMLSRLPDVADAVSMLLGHHMPSSPSASGNFARARKAISTDEVCASVAKSSKIALSISEALEALQLLCEICPDYVNIKTIDGREWLCAASRQLDLRACKETLRQELIKT